MDVLISVLASSSFLEKAALFVLGAILTGILVPFVKSNMDRAAFERKRTFEALLARQSDVIKAQTQFLTNFSNHIWEHHMISQRVSFCRLWREKEAYQKAVDEFQGSIWESLHKIRSAIGAARWFTSDTAHQALGSWYEGWFITLTSNLEQLIASDSATEIWRSHHDRVHVEASERNYGLLRLLAEDFRIRPLVDGPNHTHDSPEK